MQDTTSRRLAELLAGEAAGQLDADERAELATLMAEAGDSIERDELEHAAALAQLAFLKDDPDVPSSLPADVEARLMARAAEWSASRGRTAVSDLEAARRRRARADAVPPDSSRTRTTSGRAGWYIAACLALALVLSLLSPQDTQPPAVLAADFATQREALLRETDVIVAPWTPSEQSGYESVTGDVVWSGGRQEGFLRLTGLPPNEAASAQYQLWIVAPDRDTHPVDGGIFDVGESGEVLVKIDAKLQVPEAAAFAITLEKPGGVVVSAGPLLVVAPVGS